MLRKFAMTLATIGLSACVQTGDAHEAPGEPSDGPLVEQISFGVEPCFGFCPDFDLDIGASGQGTFEGQNFVAARGRHEFAASPQEVAAFRRRLAPFRPPASVAYNYENCDGPVATDMPSVRVTWHDADGGSTTLDWYMGCRQAHLVDRSSEIYEAWKELPIEDLVGSDEERMNYRPQ